MLKRLEMFYIFWTNVSKWKYIKFWDKRLCTYFYVGSTISSLLQACNIETRKTISISRPEGVPAPLQAHTPWPSLPPFWNLCFSSLLSCSTPFNPLSINDEYMTNMVMTSWLAKKKKSEFSIRNNNRNLVTLAAFSKNHFAVPSFWISLMTKRIFFRLIFC